MTTKIYLIRHGQTEWNKKGKIQGLSDIMLNKEGLQEAKAVGEYFKDKIIHALYSSPLRRALQTAEEIAKHKDYPIRKINDFREIRFGIYEGVKYEDAIKSKEFQKGLKEQGHFYYRPPQGESYADFYERVSKKLDEIVKKHKNEHIAIVAHGGVVRSIAHKLGLITHNLIRQIHIQNAKPYIFQYRHSKEKYTPLDFEIEYINRKSDSK